MAKDRTKTKKNESVSAEECSGEEVQYSGDELEEAEELLEDVEVSGSDGQSQQDEASEFGNQDEASGSENQDEANDEVKRTVFIKGIDYDLREEDLKKHMKKIGEVVRVTIPLTYDQRRNKGFAYVEFEEEGGAEKALRLDGKELLGREVTVSQARPRENRKIHTLFVKNLNYGTSKAELQEYFGKFGKVYNVTLPVDAENSERNKGFCFVEFTDAEAIQQILSGKHRLNDRNLYIDEGNKNGERNRRRSNDRLYGRRDGNERNSRGFSKGTSGGSKGKNNKIVFEDSE